MSKNRAIRLNEKVAQFPDVPDNEIRREEFRFRIVPGILRNLQGGVKSCFTGEHEDTHGSGIVGHCGIGINPVTGHYDFVHLQAVTVVPFTVSLIGLQNGREMREIPDISHQG